MQSAAFQVSPECLGSMEEMGTRETKDLSEHPAQRALQDLKEVKEEKGSKPRPLRKTGNNVRGIILVMEETMG